MFNLFNVCLGTQKQKHKHAAQAHYKGKKVMLVSSFKINS